MRRSDCERQFLGHTRRIPFRADRRVVASCRAPMLRGLAYLRLGNRRSWSSVTVCPDQSPAVTFRRSVTALQQTIEIRGTFRLWAQAALAEIACASKHSSSQDYDLGAHGAMIDRSLLAPFRLEPRTSICVKWSNGTGQGPAVRRKGHSAKLPGDLFAALGTEENKLALGTMPGDADPSPRPIPKSFDGMCAVSDTRGRQGGTSIAATDRSAQISFSVCASAFTLFTEELALWNGS